MSDLVTAGNTAASIKERMRAAESLAQPGTQAHWQIVSASLMSLWPRIQFCLDVLEKEHKPEPVDERGIDAGEVEVRPHPAPRNDLALEWLRRMLTRTQFIVQMILALARRYPTLTTAKAMDLAAVSYREFMASEKIEYGDPRYDWTAAGAADLIAAVDYA